MSEKNMNSITVIESINPNKMSTAIEKIVEFQKLVQNQLKQNHDYGIIPGTSKPTLLKPGAEKINMMLGLTSEFEVVDATRDWENGFFQYQVKCKLMRNGVVITEGLGACNTRENKYKKQDPYTLDNTILKMAKKRALIDATLHVASLSDIFTQDLEDMDLEGESVQQQQEARYYTDADGTITQKQAKRMFALARGNADIVKRAMSEYGYPENARSTDVQKVDYEGICNRIEQLVAEKAENVEVEVVE